MEGVFFSESENSLRLLRFYNDRTVIGVSTSATYDQIPTVLTWFDKDSPRKPYSEGLFDLSNSNRIRFTLKSSDGIVAYEGEVSNYREIKLNIHSHINDHRSQSTYRRYESETNTKVNPNKEKAYDLSLFNRQVSSEYSTRISRETKKALEVAFEYFVANISDPFIISQIQYEGDEGSKVYLIAKNPSKDAFYGIMDNPYVSKMQIACFPEGNITHSSFRELDIKPFPAKQILEK